MKLFLSLALCASTQSYGMEFLRRVKNFDLEYPAARVEMHDGFAVTRNEQIMLTTTEYAGLLAGVIDGVCCPAPGGGVRSIMLGYCMGKATGAGVVAVWRCCECDGDGEKKRK